MSNKKSQVLSKVATLLEKFSDRLVRVSTKADQNAEQISLVIGSLDKRDAHQAARDQNNVQSLVNLKDSTQKGFDQVRQDVESLLKTIQRLNERLGQVETHDVILTSLVNQPQEKIDQSIVNSKLSGVYNVTEDLDRRIRSLEENPCAAWHHMVGIESRVTELEEKSNWNLFSSYFGYEAVAKGNELKLLSGGDLLEVFSVPPESGQITSLDVKPYGLLISTKSGDIYILCGGPTTVTMFLNLIKKA